jgi:hypothetical protein
MSVVRWRALVDVCVRCRCGAVGGGSGRWPDRLSRLRRAAGALGFQTRAAGADAARRSPAGARAGGLPSVPSFPRSDSTPQHRFPRVTRNSSPGDAGRYLRGQHVSVAQAHGSAHAEDVRSGIGFGPDVVAEAQPIYERSSVRELVRSRTVVGVPGGPPFPDAEPGSWIPPHVGCGSAPCVARSADFAEVCRRRCFCRRQVDEFSSNETRGFRNCGTVPLRYSSVP